MITHSIYFVYIYIIIIIYIFTNIHIYIYIIQIDSRLEVLWNYTPWTRLNLGLALSLEKFSPGTSRSYAGHRGVPKLFFFRSAKVGHILDSSAIISYIFEAIFEDLFKLSSVSEPILGFPTFE